MRSPAPAPSVEDRRAANRSSPQHELQARTGGTADRFVADSLALQRLVGNSAFGLLLRAHSQPPSPSLMRRSSLATLVQRCGDTPCDCTDEERVAKTTPRAAALAQREEADDTPQDPG